MILKEKSTLKGAFVVLYKNVDGYLLKLHIFQPDNPRNKKHSAVVFFSGGGWLSCNIKQFEEHCRFFSSKGMESIIAEYRVKSIHGVTPFECIADAKSAIRWVRSHSENIGVDPTRIVASGGSAGGHIAACAGILKKFDEKNEDLEISSIPDALLLFNPAVDTSHWIERFGIRWRDASPLHNIDSDVPPTIIFHGTKDNIVPFCDILHFASIMKSYGNLCKVVPFEGKGHGFFNYRRDRKVYYETISESYKFLASLGLSS